MHGASVPAVTVAVTHRLRNFKLIRTAGATGIPEPPRPWLESCSGPAGSEGSRRAAQILTDPAIVQVPRGLKGPGRAAEPGAASSGGPKPAAARASRGAAGGARLGGGER